MAVIFCENEVDGMHYHKIVRDTEKRADFFLNHQILDPREPNYGGLLTEGGLVQAKSTMYGAANLIALYCNQDSRYHQDRRLLDRVRIALAYVKRQHNEDGTFDYINCNFNAAPDTAFCLKGLLPSWRLLCMKEDADSTALKNDIADIFRRAAYGIMQGGFHTPNHRWAIASILMACFNMFGDESMKAVADSYLLEGIDCTGDGEYAERSAGGYNAVNNDAMILLGEETGDESYFGHVVRNLNMMFTYVEPDGSIFTNNSTRQDYGRKVYPENYYFEYLYMAHRTGNAAFAAAANQIMEDIIERGHLAPDCLPDLMANPQLVGWKPEGCGFPTQYRRNYRDSGIVRVRRGDTSYSLLNNSDRFLYFQTGALTASLRIGVTYFDQRSFRIQQLEEREGGFTLHYKAAGWYYKPFKENPGTTDWWAMDNASREKIHGPDLQFTVWVDEVEDGVSVRIKTEGCPKVPVKVELCLSKGCSVHSEHFMTEGAAGGSIVAASGTVTVEKGVDVMRIGPAFGTHHFVGGYAGSETASRDHFTLYFTDYSHFDRTFVLSNANGRPL